MILNNQEQKLKIIKQQKAQKDYIIMKLIKDKKGIKNMKKLDK